MGEYTHAIDAKGRVILPADFRSELGVSFVITKGLDRCLFLYAQAEWDALAAKLRTLPLVKPEARALARFFFASARTLECDKQGYAGITLRQDVVLTGTDSRIEVWSRERWQAYTDEVEPDVTAIAATLTDLGI